MIFYLIGLVILLYAFVNFKSGFMLYSAFKLLLVTNITLISIPGVPLLTLEIFLTMMFILLFFINGARHQYAHMPFPYKLPFFILFICWLISSVFGIAGFGVELSNLVKTVAEEIIFIWILWEVIDSKKDFEKIYQYITIVIFFSCIYAFIELSLQSNPLAVYEATLNEDKSKNIFYEYLSDSRGYRVKSCFEHSIGAGINWGMYAVFTMWHWINNNKNKKSFWLSIITAFLCIPCIILTRMRTPILFTVISSLCLLNFKRKKFYAVIIAVLIGIGFMHDLVADNATIFLSFFNESAQRNVGGSDLNMRMMQMSTAVNLVKMSPVVGLGNKFASVLSESLIRGLLGLESIWLNVIVQYGIIGVISYVVYAVYSIIVIPFKIRSRPILFFALAYWISYTCSSLPGMKLYLYFMIMIYFIKDSEQYQIAKQRGNIYGIYFKAGRLKYGLIKRKLKKV